MYEPKTTVCPHCRKQLPWLDRVKGLNFCSPEHREAYLAVLDAAILARLARKRVPLDPRKPGRSLKAPRQPITALVLATARPN